MNELLRPKETVTTQATNQKCRIEKFLGGGGQGEVYRADLDGVPVAVKWYFSTSATVAQRAALEELIRLGAPDNRFLWPLDLLSGHGIEGFGYVMALRDVRFKGIVDLMKRRVEPSFRSLAKAGCQLAESYLRLHSKGLCYRDISFGNVFFDPNTGDILICDNDNVGVNNGQPSGILGTPGFMAPEVVRGEARPGTQTDLFSLSVLLFYMFMVHHPLEGKKEAEIKCFDLPAKNRLYGSEPVFIFDPVNDTNRPVRGFHDNVLEFWPLYPEFFQALFTRAFTNGIRDPEHGRVRESEWRAAMVKLADSIFHCAHCGSENFYDVAKVQTDGSAGKCWGCKRDLHLPARIRIGNSVVLLNADAELCHHHIDATRGYDFTKTIASVARHPTDPGIWGLKNNSATRWTCTYPDGKIIDVDPGKRVTLQSGVRINFGAAEGEVR